MSIIIDVSDLDQADVLAVLYNARLLCHDLEEMFKGPYKIDKQYAQKVIDNARERGDDYIETLHGRFIHLNIKDGCVIVGLDTPAQVGVYLGLVLHDLRETGDIASPAIHLISQKIFLESGVPGLVGMISSESISRAVLAFMMMARMSLLDVGALSTNDIPSPPNLEADDYVNWAADQAIKHYDKGAFHVLVVFADLIKQHPEISHLAMDPATIRVLRSGDDGRSTMESAMCQVLTTDDSSEVTSEDVKLVCMKLVATLSSIA